MRNKKRVTIYLNPKIWSEYQKLCSILDRIPSKEIETNMKEQNVKLKLVGFLNKEVKTIPTHETVMKKLKEKEKKNE